MKLNFILPTILTYVSFLALPSYAIETRCGWLVNPTPANWFLKDADGTWIISAQGGYQAPGMENIPDLQSKEYVKTNGNYGYTCACLDATTDRSKMRITRIQSAELLSLSTCQNDPNLPEW